MEFQVFLQSGQGVLHHINEVETTGGGAAHADDDVAFGVVVGDGEDFAVGFEAVGGAFDEVVGGLAGFGEEDLDVAVGVGFRGVGGCAGAVEEDGDGGAGGVLVAGEDVDEFVAGGGGMARFAGGEFR